MSKRLTIICPHCEKPFTAFPSQKRITCSIYCARMNRRRQFGTKSYPSRGYKREHVFVAERALGHALPKGAEVHHVDGDKRNSANRNLVICQDHAYHRLLHRRARVKAFGGNPNTDHICTSCKQLVTPTDRSRIYGKRCVCRPCFNRMRRAWRARKRAAHAA